MRDWPSDENTDGRITSLPFWSCQFIFFKLTHLLKENPADERILFMGVGEEIWLGYALCVCGVEVFGGKYFRGL
jgi:hypothetical protein